MAEESSDLLTQTEAAYRARVSERTIRKWIEKGNISTHQTPDGPRVDRASLDAFRRERARTRAGVVEPGTALATGRGSELAAGLLAALERQGEHLAAQSAQLAELRAELATVRALLEARAEPGSEPAPAAEPEPEAAPEAEPGSDLPAWRRWLGQWRWR